MVLKDRAGMVLAARDVPSASGRMHDDVDFGFYDARAVPRRQQGVRWGEEAVQARSDGTHAGVRWQGLRAVTGGAT